MTKGLIKSCNNKAKLYKNFKRSGLKVDKLRYLTYLTKLLKILRIAETTYYAEKFRSLSTNLKKTWSLLNTIINKNHISDLTNPFLINGSLTTNPIIIADKLNEYFVNIGPTLASKINTEPIPFYTFLDGNYMSSFAVTTYGC